MIGDSSSRPRTITCGVSQGSILGPLLFLIYVNDLPAGLKYSTARMFADDTNITTSNKSTVQLHRQRNHDLGTIQYWLLANRLSLNVLKTEYIYFASDYSFVNLGTDVSEAIRIGDKPLSRVQSTKSLGTQIDERLVW